MKHNQSVQELENGIVRVKGKCVLSIVPKSAAVNTFNIDPLCKIKAK